MVTIKELSEELGVSKVGITKWLERNDLKDQLEKVGNKYMIPAEVENAIRAKFAHRENKPDKTMNGSSETENTVTEEIIALLRDQLEAKDREIDRLHTQVENLQALNADMTKAIREINTLQAMQITDGSERTTSEQRENAVSGREAVERSRDEAVRKKSIWKVFKRFFI